MKTNIKKLYNSRAFWVIISLICSVIMWVYVASVETEEFKQTFRGVRVQLVGETLLRDSKNLVITDMDTSTVTVEVVGPRRIVGSLDSDSLYAQIDVSKLSFRYEEGGPMILDNLSLKIHPGEYIGIVGKSGCGKSTLIRLLLGFEKPLSGSVFYGPASYDVANVDLHSLRRHIGTVLQDGRLFPADIFNNIVLSTPEATLDDAWRAAELAGIADDIRRMPMGMNTVMFDGIGNISGGQRQRLLIARAVCGERKILILDEATSALDNITQKHVTDSLASLKCTRIVVAHRLSTVKDCDRIICLDKGHIVEEGSYDDLIAKNGFFAGLVARQRPDDSVRRQPCT